jgi:hypothetical protein
MALEPGRSLVRDLHEDPGDKLHRVDRLALGRFDVVVPSLGRTSVPSSTWSGLRRSSPGTGWRATSGSARSKRRSFRPSAVSDLRRALDLGEGSRPPSAPAWLALALRQLGRSGESARWRARAEDMLRRLEGETAVQTEWEVTSGQGRLVAWEQRAQIRILLAELDHRD